MAAISILLWGIVFMEQSIEYIRGALQSLVWDKGKEKEKEAADEETAIDVKSPVPKPWYRRSRKSIVRMIGSKVFWQTQDNGRRRRFKNRSVVRMLASRLPLKPTKRAYFEIFAESQRAVMDKARTFVEENLNTVKSHMTEIGLADMGLFSSWDGFEVESKANKSGIVTRNTLESSSFSLSHISDVSSEEIAAPPRVVKRGRKLREKETSQKKISALEDELANLRAQIAMIVTIQDQQPKAPEPVIPMAPPPPPPPPPMMPATPPPSSPAMRKPLQRIKKENNLMNSKAKENGVPAMRDVLAGLSSVKLKSSSIQRSPGGTPMRMKSTVSTTSSTNPADVIANALRKKFAKVRRSIGSPAVDKENHLSPHAGFSPSPKKGIEISGISPITSSPEKGRKSRRRSNALTGKTIILSPVRENAS